MTLDEIIEQLKTDNPTLRVGSDQEGYREFDDDEYEATILEWAHNRLAKLQKAELELQEKAAAEAKKAAAEAKLIALGLDLDDLRALGL